MSGIVDLISEGGVLFSSGHPGLQEVVAALADQLVRRGRVDADLRELAVQSVGEREELASTVMVDIGVSIPHAHVDGIEGVVAALALAEEGVFLTESGVPISIVALVLSSPHLEGDEYLNVLSDLSLLLQSETFRAEITRAGEFSQVIELMRSRGRTRS